MNVASSSCYQYCIHFNHDAFYKQFSAFTNTWYERGGFYSSTVVILARSHCGALIGRLTVCNYMLCRICPTIVRWKCINRWKKINEKKRQAVALYVLHRLRETMRGGFENAEF